MMSSVPQNVENLLVAAMESTQRFVRGVAPNQWHNPTPDEEWDMRVLVNHITSENLWLAEMLNGRTMEDIGDSFSGDLLGDDPVRAFEQSVARVKPALTPAALDGTYRLSFGEASGREYVTQIFLDQLVHGWDVAKGSGQQAVLDETLVREAVPVAAEMAAMVGEGSVFGYRQQVPDNASPQTRLLAILGRRDDWAPPAGGSEGRR